MTIIIVLLVVVVLASIPKTGQAVWKPIAWVLNTASAEFILLVRPNGGDVVFVRALWTSMLFFLGAIGIRERLIPGSTWQFSGERLRIEAISHMDWLGAAFAGIYAVFYTRFSSQWTYLAGLYNQIMAAQAQTSAAGLSTRVTAYTAWWAAFIEDAEDVHLASKRSYASIIAGLLSDSEIVETYKSSTVDGERRLSRLENRLKRALGPEVFERLTQPTPELERSVNSTLTKGTR